MNVQSSEVSAIVTRVEKLERENARLKRILAAVAIVVGALLLMGQTKQGAIRWQKQVLRAGTVQANKIEVLPEGAASTNGSTPIPIIRITGSPFGSEISMFDQNGKATVSLNGSLGVLQMGQLSSDDTGYVGLANPGHTVTLSGFGESGSLILNDKTGEQTAYVGASLLGATLNLVSDNPRMTLGTQNGYRTEIGSTDLVTVATGATRRTSAASIVLFDDKKNVTWSAEQSSALEMLVGPLLFDLDNRKRELRELSDELDHFKKAACPVLRTARMDVLTKGDLDSACGLY